MQDLQLHLDGQFMHSRLENAIENTICSCTDVSFYIAYMHGSCKKKIQIHWIILVFFPYNEIIHYN